MGFTPLDGVLMGTRTGSIDPAVVPVLMQKKGLDAAGVDKYMNKECGVLGVSGVSSDFRDLEDAAAKGNERASWPGYVLLSGETLCRCLCSCHGRR